MTDVELAKLWSDLIRELMNPNLSGRTHGNRRTYDAGCQGPLCMKAVRENARRRREHGTSEKYLFVDQILAFWYPRAAMAIQDARNDLMKRLIG